MYSLNLSDIANRLRNYKGRCLTLTLQNQNDSHTCSEPSKCPI